MPRPLLLSFFVLLSATTAGCSAGIDDPAPALVPVLDAWTPGWFLNYTAADGSWQTMTVLRDEPFGNWSTHVVEWHQVAGVYDKTFSSWIERDTRGLVKSTEDITVTLDCPAWRMTPLANTTYTCSYVVFSRPPVQMDIVHTVISINTTEFRGLGTFTEVAILEHDLRGGGFDQRYSYSPEVGAMTRFWADPQGNGDDAEYVLTSMSMQRGDPRFR